MQTPESVEIARNVDLPLLEPARSDQDLAERCRRAGKAGMAAVVVPPYAVRLAVDALAGSATEASAAIGLPHGGHTTAVKVFEAQQALADGAGELEFAANVGKILSEDWAHVGADVGAVVCVARERKALVKVVVETAWLEETHLLRLAELCGAVGAHFLVVRAAEGATDDWIARLRASAPPGLLLKVVGGIQSLADVRRWMELGVARFETSSTEIWS